MNKVIYIICARAFIIIRTSTEKEMERGREIKKAVGKRLTNLPMDSKSILNALRNH